jgi:hypothetical protein
MNRQALKETVADPTNEPTMVAKKPKPRWVWWLGSVFGLLLLAAVFSAVYGRPSARAITTKNLSQGKGIYPAIKMYAGAHQGHYPRSLLELEPVYLDAGRVELTKYFDADSRRLYDWHYFQGLSEASPATWIVLASPTDQIYEDRARRGRIVVFNDGGAAVLPAGKFDAMLAEQVKAMAAQAP